MAIGMGECREKVRSMMIEVRPELPTTYFLSGKGTNTVVENDTACGKTAGGAGLST
jgi:hypothetical protein